MIHLLRVTTGNGMTYRMSHTPDVIGEMVSKSLERGFGIDVKTLDEADLPWDNEDFLEMLFMHALGLEMTPEPVTAEATHTDDAEGAVSDEAGA